MSCSLYIFLLRFWGRCGGVPRTEGEAKTTTIWVSAKIGGLKRGETGRCTTVQRSSTFARRVSPRERSQKQKATQMDRLVTNENQSPYFTLKSIRDSSVRIKGFMVLMLTPFHAGALNSSVVSPTIIVTKDSGLIVARAVFIT